RRQAPEERAASRDGGRHAGERSRRRLHRGTAPQGAGSRGAAVPLAGPSRGAERDDPARPHRQRGGPVPRDPGRHGQVARVLRAQGAPRGPGRARGGGMTAHTDVGAYSMGLLEERDRREFEDHLAGCPACAVELAELSPMAALFQGVELRGEEPAGGEVTDLIRRRARQQRYRRRWQVALGAAAGIVLIGGGIGTGIALAPQHGNPPAPGVALTGQLHSATDPGTGVAGTVGLVAKAWGTQVTLDLSKVAGPAECELVAVSTTGERRVVMGWLGAAPGDGVPGHPAHLVIRGGTSIPRSDLARVDVDVVNGRTLVSIPV